VLRGLLLLDTSVLLDAASWATGLRCLRRRSWGPKPESLGGALRTLTASGLELATVCPVLVEFFHAAERYCGLSKRRDADRGLEALRHFLRGLLRDVLVLDCLGLLDRLEPGLDLADAALLEAALSVSKSRPVALATGDAALAQRARGLGIAAVTGWELAELLGP
jgi:hypothetical protein